MGYSVLVAAYALVVLQTIFIVAAAVVRFWMLGGWTKGKGAYGTTYDILFVIGVISGVGSGIVLAYGCDLILDNSNNFKVSLMVSPSMREMGRLFLGNAALYLVSIYALKLAFLFLYWSLYDRISSLRMWPIYTTFIILLAAFVGTFAAYFIVCGRGRGPLQGVVSCVPLYHFGLQTATNIIGLATDLILLVLPLRILSRLPKNSRAEKYARIFVIFIGSLSIVATIIRYSILNASGTLRRKGITSDGKLTMRPDKSLALMGMLSMAEIGAAVAAFSLPALQPVLKRVIKKYGWQRGEYSSGVVRGL